MPIFFKIETKNKEEIVKYCHFDNVFFPNFLFVRDPNEDIVAIDVKDIKSIEIALKICDRVHPEDKEKFSKLDISFDEKGFIIIPSDKFLCETRVVGENCFMKIFSVDKVIIATIIAEIGQYHPIYCGVYWDQEC